MRQSRAGAGQGPVPWDVPGRSLLLLQLLLLQPRDRKGPDPACPGSLHSSIPCQAAALSLVKVTGTQAGTCWSFSAAGIFVPTPGPGWKQAVLSLWHRVGGSTPRLLLVLFLAVGSETSTLSWEKNHLSLFNSKLEVGFAADLIGSVFMLFYFQFLCIELLFPWV